MGCRENAVLEGGKVTTNLRLGSRIDLSQHTAPAARQPLQDATPVVDDHAVAVSLTPIGMETGLRWRNYIREILYCTRAQ